MADVVAPLRHLKTYPADGPLAPADIAEHQIAAGTVPEGYALRARAAATRKLIWTDDAGADRNNPLRAVLVSDSAAVSNTASLTAFNKVLVLEAGVANVQGARIRVAASGKWSSKAVDPGTLTFFVYWGGAAHGASYVDPLPAQVNHGWSVWQELLVRTTGAGASVQPHGGYAGIYSGDESAFKTGGRAFGDASLIVPFTVDLTAAWVISLVVQWSVADPANSITMTAMSLDVALPGVVVT